MAYVKDATLRAVLLAISLLFLASVAEADPIVLSSGVFSSTGSGSGFDGILITDAHGTGPGLSFEGHNINDLCTFNCGASQAGSITTLNFGLLGSGTVIYQGIQYHSFTLSFGFTGDTITGAISVFENSEPAHHDDSYRAPTPTEATARVRPISVSQRYFHDPSLGDSRRARSE